MTDANMKDLFKSRTFLSASLGLVVMSLEMLGVNIVEANQNITNLVEVVSMLAAVYFHTVSTQPVGSIAGFDLPGK